MNKPVRQEFSQFVHLAVRWGDMDALGHVNNAKYFTYEESSRIQYFQPLVESDPRLWKDYGPILASIGADFLSQVHYPAELEIGTRILRMGRSSLNTLSCMFIGEAPVAMVRSVIVWFDYVNQKPAPIPEEVRAWIRGRELVAPEE